MIYNWIKGLIRPRNHYGSYENRLEREKLRVEKNYIETRWTNLEFRTLK
ncbi:MAG: hypothetical protein RIN55_02715 [Tissierellaceae bacterium]|nr:hypothetical protein [Tissierellaceae bacterium]